jgi:hypothetical protein
VKDARTIYDQAGWRVHVVMNYDDLSDPRTDGDCYTVEDIAAWRRDEWEYMHVRVEVEFHCRTVGEASCGGIEHGDMAEREVDAWELEPARYETRPDGTPVIHAGSPLSGVVMEAVTEAHVWFARNVKHLPEGVADLVHRFDPHRE